MLRTLFAVSLSLVALAPHAASAQARTRTTTGRARAELAFDHGFGFGTEGEFAELATDFRLYAPFGFGAVLRAGLATRYLSHAIAIDLGVAQRLDLVDEGRWGLQLAGALGASSARGPFDVPDPFDGPDSFAWGAFGMVHLDLWMREMTFGVGVTTHALWVEGHGQDARAEPILTVTPMLRVGGDWGL